MVGSSTYAVSAWLFTRALSAIYFIAFLSLASQVRGLWGTQGLLPAGRFLEAVTEQLPGIERLYQLPTVFWLDSSDRVLFGCAFLGALAALAAFAGLATGWMLLLCWALYLSFLGIGQDFLSFQWDTLLVEVGFLALFVVPWSVSWHPWLANEPMVRIRWLFYLVLFKLMFLSGVVKILSGDPSWRDLSALTYHYWTQPLPNPLSPFLHALPEWVHRISTFMTFVIELALPFFIFVPRFRLVAAVGFALLSMFIFVTGNYTFFNLLTIALCLWLIPDSQMSSLKDRLQGTSDIPLLYSPISYLTLLLAAVNLFWCLRFLLPQDIDRSITDRLGPVRWFHLSNPYGLFANMTKSRPEIVIEGSNNGLEWKEYVFRFKPGPLNRRLPIVAPFQPRLDWQMWFAALSTFAQNPWLQNLFVRLFENEPEVIALLAENPFHDQAPRFLRARLYDYQMSEPNKILTEGLWWKRSLLYDYTPILQRPSHLGQR